MKIRGPSELSDALAKALAWRKKEITNIRFLIEDAKRSHRLDALRRMAVPMLYSHWEGFVKQAAQFYLEMVVRQGLPYERLKTNFVAISIRRILHDATEAKKIDAQIAAVEFLTYNQGNRAKISSDGVIDTASNLNSEVFSNILTTIGIKCDSFWDNRFLLIDGSLLKNRNKIVHGEMSEIDSLTYDQLHDLVIEMLNKFCDCIENAAASKDFLRS